MVAFLTPALRFEHPLVLVLAVAVTTLAVVAIYRTLCADRYPRNLPRIGAREGVPWQQMRKKFQADCLAVFDDAYENYSKRGQSVLIPVFGPNDEVILPPTSLQWLVRQPEDVVNSLAAQVDSIQLEHSLGYKFAYDPWGGMLIKKDLNSAMDAMCAIMSDELNAAFEATFGTDTQNWKELDLFPTCRMLSGQLTQRFTVGDSPEGLKLARDKSWVQSCYNVLDGMLDVAGAAASYKRFLRPVVAQWTKRAMPGKLGDLKQRFEPLYRERLSIVERKGVNDNIQGPRDLLGMMMDYAVNERPDEALNLDDMAKRLAVMNFGTMHQTVLTLHNLLLDVLGSDQEFNTVSVLREEVQRVMGPGDLGCKQWNKAKFQAMTRADSICRETLRVHTFLGRAVQRLVVGKDGLVTEDGIRVPQGAMVSILAHQTQTDADTYKDPHKYDPFRHSRRREAAAEPGTGKPGLHNLSFVATSAENLPFNHGKHACPGRFLVEYEFKLIMAYAVMNYDIELPESYGGKRPPNTWFAGFGIPPLEAKIRVRRRSPG
ncbi:hypothetical protein JX266_006374 [Neoarthrinium moseri]|uniref:uncharacterized protein n=1 Tax=Neoarthrinium moseri TaxID=1658444 RepID=UPI001FDE046B|nr:uncharacterized protein JN550_007121 [Neoarthrinium moseri]KAI1847522.1 hypothetical protein JX266_006374 [Neoarthrinium moseri]KAI1867390.1 hypothetical protein JN550_007121 [Neoarthrinium moseri]